MNQLYEEVFLSETNEYVGTGWIPPLPDLRDYTVETPVILEMIQKLNINLDESVPRGIPTKVDLRPWCSPVENQGRLGSCTANAAAGVVEYYEIRAFHKYIDASRLFIYKATRDLMGVKGDTGAWLRTTMGALALCGVPPEKYWPYTDKKPDFDREPPAFVYAVADNYEALRYFCYDPIGRRISPSNVLRWVKIFLAAGIPSMFGFFGFSSFSYSNVRGGIPFPCPGERAKWGHAVVAVGYDDNIKITNTRCNKTTTGALLIRNSWGVAWGDHGYGWLPYEYVLHRYARDFWSLLRMEWVNTGQFGL